MGHNWTPEEIKLLGTDADRVIGKRIGVSNVVVFNKRKELGIAPAKPWKPEWVELLKTLTAAECAKIIGCSERTITVWRNKLGIPNKDYSVPFGEHPMDALLGKLPDTAVARQVGCSKQWVHERRKKFGIPSHLEQKRNRKES